MDATRFRALLADIAERGILVPLEITAEGVVLDGHQRLRAARELGHTHAPVRVVAPHDEVEHMLLAALQRRDLNPGQRGALGFKLLDYQRLREEAKQRQRANLKGAAEVATLPPRGEKTRELLARQAGVSPRTAQDTITTSENPELFEAVKEGRIAVHRAANQVRQARMRAALPAAPPLPDGPFEAIYADPPWQLGNPTGDYAPENHYPTMPLEEIKALPVPAADDAVCFLWAVNGLLPAALEVLAAWGFTYVTHLVWVKPSIGLGNWARNRHELLLWGRKGSYPVPEPADRPDSVIEAPRGRHSEKPAVFYELIERTYPNATRVELFARQTRPGWTAWGNEVDP